MNLNTVSAILLACLLVVTGLYFYEKTSYDKLLSNYSALEKEYKLAESIWKENEDKLTKSVEKLNEEIEKYRINTEEYQMCITGKLEELEKEHCSKEEVIQKEMEKDSSSDNIVKLVEDMLYELNKNSK